MHMAYTGAAAELVGQQVELAHKLHGIGTLGLVIAHHRGVAAAIQAEPVAKRHMEVKRDHGIGGQFGQPLRIGLSPDAGVKMRRRRVASIARDAAVITGGQFGIGESRRHAACFPSGGQKIRYGKISLARVVIKAQDAAAGR
jgi:hypothetical protein